MEIFVSEHPFHLDPNLMHLTAGLREWYLHKIVEIDQLFLTRHSQEYSASLPRNISVYRGPLPVVRFLGHRD